MRPIKITTDFVKFPEGSCLIECGDTKVLCCASIEDKTPPHVPEGEGWVTAEYSMLPRANRERSKRDIAKLKLSPRSAEIQRLVGRSLRAAVDRKALGERTINIDCDVLQGDGGMTRILPEFISRLDCIKADSTQTEAKNASKAESEERITSI